MKSRRALLVAILVISIAGVAYATFWLTQITSLSDTPNYPPERIQFSLVAGFGLLFAATLLGAVAIVALLRQNRR